MPVIFVRQVCMREWAGVKGTHMDPPRPLDIPPSRPVESGVQ